MAKTCKQDESIKMGEHFLINLIKYASTQWWTFHHFKNFYKMKITMIPISVLIKQMLIF